MKIKKSDIVIAWNEIEEVTTNLRELCDEDIIDLRHTIYSRLLKTMGILGKYITDKDLKKAGII